MMLWLYLAMAVALGAVPARVFWGRGFLFVDGQQLRARFFMANPGDNRRRRRWWKSLALWVEPARGVLIGWLVARALRLETGDLDRSAYMALKLACHGLLLAVALWQTCGRGRDGQTLAPILLIGGLLAGGIDCLLGVSATVIALLVLFAAQSVSLALMAMAGTTLAAGWLLIGPGPTLLVATALGAVPLVRSFALRQPLVMALRG